MPSPHAEGYRDTSLVILVRINPRIWFGVAAAFRPNDRNKGRQSARRIDGIATISPFVVPKVRIGKTLQLAARTGPRLIPNGTFMARSTTPP